MAKEEMLDGLIAGYEEKLRQNPNSLVFVQLADAMRKKGRFDEALGVLDQGLSKNPNLLSALIMTGRIHISRDRPAEAIEVLKRAIGREPGNLTAHALLSQAYLATNSLREAIVEFQRILSLNPEDAAAQQALQTVLARMKKDKAGAPKPDAGKAPAAPAPEEKAAAAPALELPAYAAAEELLARGLFDEAAEAFQRILDSDPDNAMARMKLQEAQSMRDATESPSSVADRSALPSGPVQSHADKITDDEILFLLGLMEAGAAPPGEAEAAAPTIPEPKPAAPVRAEKPAVPPPAATPPEPPAQPAQPAPTAPVAPSAPEAPPAGESGALDEARVLEALSRLASTEGMRQVFLVNGPQVICSGSGKMQDNEKVVTLVKMLSDVTRRAASQMKQGEVKQVLVFGTEGIVMVSSAQVGILAAVAGAAVRVGLMRIALNDCLKRLAGVS